MNVHARLLAPALVAAACSALVLTGCSAKQAVTENTGEGQQVGGDSATPGADKSGKEPKAKLVKAGFGKDGDYGYASAIVTNSSPDNVGMFVTVQFNLLDSEGDLVGSDSQVEQFTSANQTLALGSQFEMEGKKKVAKVEATLGLDNKMSMDDQPNLPVGKVKVKKVQYEGTQAIFEVRNPGSVAQKGARIGVVCFNKSGKIIGGGSEYPDLIPAKGRVLVESHILSAGMPAKCDAYAAPSTM